MSNDIRRVCVKAINLKLVKVINHKVVKVINLKVVKDSRSSPVVKFWFSGTSAISEWHGGVDHFFGELSVGGWRQV